MIRPSACCETMRVFVATSGDDMGIELDSKSKAFAVNGCCGGCFVMTDMRFCPFCGAEMKPAEGVKADQ